LCTLTAGWQKVFSANPKIGFLAHAADYQMALKNDIVLASASSLSQMQQIIFNDRIDAALALFFSIVVIAIFLCGVYASWCAYRNYQPTVHVDDALSSDEKKSRYVHANHGSGET
jgi:carbon starvation protein